MNLHFAPHIEDRYETGDTYYEWDGLFGLRSHHVSYLRAHSLRRHHRRLLEQVGRNYHYCVMSLGEIKVLYPHRSHRYSPKHFCKSPTRAATVRAEHHQDVPGALCQQEREPLCSTACSQ